MVTILQLSPFDRILYAVNKTRYKWTIRNAVEVNMENETLTVAFTLSLKPEIWKFLVVVLQT